MRSRIYPNLSQMQLDRQKAVVPEVTVDEYRLGVYPDEHALQLAREGRMREVQRARERVDEPYSHCILNIAVVEEEIRLLRESSSIVAEEERRLSLLEQDLSDLYSTLPANSEKIDPLKARWEILVWHYDVANNLFKFDEEGLGMVYYQVPTFTLMRLAAISHVHPNVKVRPANTEPWYYAHQITNLIPANNLHDWAQEKDFLLLEDNLPEQHRHGLSARQFVKHCRYVNKPNAGTMLAESHDPEYLEWVTARLE